MLETDGEVQKYDEWLFDYAEKGLRAMVEVWSGPLNKSLMAALRLRFFQRVEHWRAEARRIVTARNSEGANRNVPVTQGDQLATDHRGQESSKLSKSEQNRHSKAEKIWSSRPETNKRRTIVKQNPTLTAQGICRLFDESHVPLTKSVKEAGTWSKAFKAPLHRHAVEVLISRDKKVVSE